AALEPFERGDQGLRHVAATERTEAAACIGKLAGELVGKQMAGVDLGGWRDHDTLSCARSIGSRLRKAARADFTKLAMSSGLLRPGEDSTPLDTSTPKGRTSLMAAATLSAVRPPARISSARLAIRRAAIQSAGMPVPLTGPSKSNRVGNAG